ncbi:ATP-dependent helicase HrpB [Neorhodopirellula pilleata]|uniref:ATP-dependent RNA helicase HrpB n=1 Tax=Neorhodopirellula pilleata TaxID=2714738 RepID=A0A5C6AQL1_9BACT|nr:ATP-dependent helicase HrpB [Neorhodopirellula pilleata]TWU01777.1 ATP-dependent RNA helicase HrpB [Neorhodopirellula pilleata]
MPLPIEVIIEPLCTALNLGQAVVLKAPPGAGKTTGVPPAILGHGGVDQAADAKQIWVIQPRRLAARSVASWLAQQHGESIGQTYGYHVRLDRKESAATRVVLMTTGMFLRRMQTDPLLENVGCVVLDEFHERTLDLDVALALTARLRATLRDDLRLIVMSATLDPKPIADFLDAQAEPDQPLAMCLESEGRSFPVETIYRPSSLHDRIENRISEGIRVALEQTDGHVLAFLPGVGEIERAKRVLESIDLANYAAMGRPSGLAIHTLHGGLSPQLQDAALRTHAGQRKIILTTNIAETSVTVEGVTAVVDSGLAKTSIMDSRLGLSRLEVTPISQASADQRAGRAGRTGPGLCVRLWAKEATSSRPSYDRPEIQRDDLSGIVLLLAGLGENDLSTIRWLTPPPVHSLVAAHDLLRQLGAIDAAGRITAIGRSMSSLPLHPRIAKFVIEALGRLPVADVAMAAALLSERDPLENRDRLSLTEKIDLVRKDKSRSGLIETIRSVARQIERTIGEREPGTDRDASRGTDEDSDWSRALLAAYPDRVVLRRSDDPDRGRMVGGRGVFGLKRFDATATGAPLMLCYDVDGGGKESRVRAAVTIAESWLDKEAIVEEVQVDFDPAGQSLRCRKVRQYIDLILNETPAKVEPNSQTQACLYQAALQEIETDETLARIGPNSASNREESVAVILQRLALVCRSAPPSMIDSQASGDLRTTADSQSSLDPQSILRSVLMELCAGRTSFAELRKAPWKDYLVGVIGYERWQIVQREAPTHLTLPSGNRAAVHYVAGKPPWIEAKIQECFGWTSTPRILFGRVNVQMHLLGPNRRAQQITEDLASFWATTYGEIRKELRRRYPKHFWPEDPLAAKATVNGLKPRDVV